MSNECNQNSIEPCSEAEGLNTTARGIAAHAKASMTTANGDASHAEGFNTTASGAAAHVEGGSTTANGDASHAEGFNTAASGAAAHAEGGSTTANGDASHAEGFNTTASSAAAHAEGSTTLANGEDSHAEGRGTQALSDHSHAEGFNTTAGVSFTVGIAAHAEGIRTIASGNASHTEGQKTRANGDASHAEGANTIADGIASHAEGIRTTASGDFSHAAGNNTSTNGFEGTHIMGRNGAVHNVDGDPSYSWNVAFGAVPYDSTGLVGKLLNNGNMFINGAYSSPEADYAEMFETVDGNPIDVGYFVTAVEKGKIRKATTGDHFILGITSATPGLLGNSAELRWQGKYLTDEWGRVKYKEVTVSAEKDDEGNTIIPERKKMQAMLNPNWNSKEKYIPRTKRTEWLAVGLLGQVLVRDDGTCEEQGYCWPNDDGVATKAKRGYFVLKRTASNQVLVLVTPIQKIISRNIIKRISRLIKNLKNKATILLKKNFWLKSKNS